MRSLIRQLYPFATDFNRVLLQQVGTDIENSLFKYRVSYMHLTFMIETFGLLNNKSNFSQPFIVYIQCHLKN